MFIFLLSSPCKVYGLRLMSEKNKNAHVTKGKANPEAIIFLTYAPGEEFSFKSLGATL